MKKLILLIFVTVMSISTMLGQTEIKGTTKYNYWTVQKWNEETENWVTVRDHVKFNSSVTVKTIDGVMHFLISLEESTLLFKGMEDVDNSDEDSVFWQSKDENGSTVMCAMSKTDFMFGRENRLIGYLSIN